LLTQAAIAAGSVVSSNAMNPADPSPDPASRIAS
jgi:hypothetical protein